VQAVFSTEWFRVYTNSDVIGVELAAAVKNVIALAAGYWMAWRGVQRESGVGDAGVGGDYSPGDGDGRAGGDLRRIGGAG